MSTTGWVLVAIAAGGVMWAVTAYNGLVQRRNRINNAFGQIDVQLKRRYDLVPNLVDVAKRYLAHEAATLEAVIRARGRNRCASSCCSRWRSPARWPASTSRWPRSSGSWTSSRRRRWACRADFSRSTSASR